MNGVSFLPHLNAGLNFLSTILLVWGFVLVRQGRTAAHRRCMLGALGSSALFLGSYLTYHLHAGRIIFREPAWFRPFYLVILLSHTILAMAIVPLVILTIRHAFRGNFSQHRQLASWTWPLWIYVSVTGVMVYLVLYQIYPQ